MRTTPTLRSLIVAGREDIVGAGPKMAVASEERCSCAGDRRGVSGAQKGESWSSGMGLWASRLNSRLVWLREKLFEKGPIALCLLKAPPLIP